MNKIGEIVVGKRASKTNSATDGVVFASANQQSPINGNDPLKQAEKVQSKQPHASSDLQKDSESVLTPQERKLEVEQPPEARNAQTSKERKEIQNKEQELNDSSQKVATRLETKAGSSSDALQKLIKEELAEVQGGPIQEGEREGLKELAKERFILEKQDPEKAGKVEAYKELEKEMVKNNTQHTLRFEKVVSGNDTILFQLRRVFPFDLNPDTITISLTKIDITHRFLFGAKNIFTILITNLIDVEVDSNFFFGNLRFKHLITPNKETTTVVPLFPKEDARRAYRIIQGLLIAKKEDIDMTKVQVQNLPAELEKLGEPKALSM